ncbi:unnamed protein product [Rhizophagus irregularis]|nr:unnamed protein product [Rhizophagus irregularis]
MCQNFVLAEDEIFDEDIVGDEEEEIVAIVPMGPILSSELEGLKATEYPLIISSIDLSINTCFSSWEVAEYYLKKYGRQKGFVIKKYRVEYHKNSSSNSCECPVKKRTLTCENSGKYKPNKTKSIAHQRNKESKKTDCKWHVNLSNPESTNYVHITFAYLQHNHPINADNKKFATAFRHFNDSVITEIEHAQKEDPTMFIQPLINVDSNCLCGIFWMTGNQILMWSHYSDVIFLGAQAFLNDETQKSYEWVFQQTLDATGIEPRVIITDMDPAVDATCQSVYKSTYHIHCIWACAFINKIFTAGMQSTQQVESINSVIHKAVAASSSMTDVVEVLSAQIQKEALNTSFIIWKHKSLTYHQPFVVKWFFSNIEKEIQKCFSFRIIDEFHNQMCESVLYRYEKISIENAFEFEEYQMNALVIEYLRLGLGALATEYLRVRLGLGALAIDILGLGLGAFAIEYLRIRDSNIPDDKVIETIEDCYDFHQIYLKALLATVSRDSIREI